MTAAAIKARASAVNCEAKKHAYRQTQDGVVISFVLHPQQVPEGLATAPLGTRYMVALVEIGDDEQPVSPPRPSTVPASAAGADKPKKTPAQIAGYLCTTVKFQKFLHEKFNQDWLRARSAHNTLGASVLPEVIAADVVRALCEVESRADITEHNVEWTSLLLSYRLWENHPELEDA